MNENEKLELIKEILEVEELSSSDQLDSFDLWDSMAVLSVLAMLEENFEKTDVPGNEISKCETVEDLMKLMEK